MYFHSLMFIPRTFAVFESTKPKGNKIKRISKKKEIHFELIFIPVKVFMIIFFNNNYYIAINESFTILSWNLIFD